MTWDEFVKAQVEYEIVCRDSNIRCMPVITDKKCMECFTRFKGMKAEEGMVQ